MLGWPLMAGVGGGGRGWRVGREGGGGGVVSLGCSFERDEVSLRERREGGREEERGRERERGREGGREEGGEGGGEREGGRRREGGRERGREREGGAGGRGEERMSCWILKQFDWSDIIILIGDSWWW